MRGIQAAKHAVPIRIIPLPAQESITRFLHVRSVLGTGSARGNGGYASGNAQHFLVKQIGLRIFPEESAPARTAKKSKQIRPGGKFLMEPEISQAGVGGKNPFHHFFIGGRGEIGAAQRRVRSDTFAWRRSLQPVCVLFQRREKILEPAVGVAMFEGTGPAA